MKKTLLAITALATLGTSSCKKSNTPTPKDAYSLKGRVLKDCSGTPITNYTVDVAEKPSAGLLGIGAHGYIQLGSATTDSNGYFIISGLTSTENLRISANSTIWADNFTVGAYDNVIGKTVDLGTFYSAYEKNAILR